MLHNPLPGLPNRCIVYTTSGAICGRPGVAIDRRHGGMICWEHLAEWARLS